MADRDVRERVEVDINNRIDTTRERIHLFYNAIKRMPEDPLRVARWSKENIYKLGNDLSAFISSIFIVTFPIGILFIGGAVPILIFDFPSPDWFETVFGHFKLFTGIALFAVAGIYAVRTWNRIRNLLTSPAEAKQPRFQTEQDYEREDLEHSTENQRQLKYRYWLWGILCHFIFITVFDRLQQWGYSVTEWRFPYSIPSFVGSFTKEMSVIWIVDGLRAVATGLTLGQAIGILLIFAIPAGLIAYGLQIHIDYLKSREDWNIIDGVLELGKLLWTTGFVIVVLAS